ncbi:hypothetical protein ACFCXT_05035 [Streptomyces vinaceus]|uniref:hypothetical protein n=1 Tax=Streptomyces vinaceus TaxID=1960 RepID=UPI0035E0BB92
MPSNRRRAAELCAQATGTPYRTCLDWAADGLITRQQPVPDAATAEQRVFEAQLATEIANELRHGPVDSALFGFVRSVPTKSGLLLDLHPAMADRVLAAVLPRIDEYYGGLRGVPGLRLTRRDGAWVLSRAEGTAAIRLRHPQSDWSPALPPHGDGLTQVWLRNRHRLHPVEAVHMSSWASRGGDPDLATALDWLNSRIPRRSALVNATCSTHGRDVYTHGSMDLVLEWCCGAEVPEMEARLRRSGLAYRPDGIGEHPRDTPWFPGEIAMGGAFVSLRAGFCGGR